MVTPSWLRTLAAALDPRRESSIRRIGRKRLKKARLCVEWLEDRSVPSGVRLWINPLGGVWDTATNWLGGILPSATDLAIINLPGNITVTHSVNTTDSIGALVCNQTLDLSAGSLSIAGNSSLNTLSLTGGTLLTPGSTAVSGLFTWDAGLLGGGGQLNAYGGIHLSPIGPTTLDSSIVNNFGAALWTGGNVNTIGGGAFNNLSGATFQANTSSTFHPILNNSGTLSLNTNGTASLDTLNNSGTVQLATGNLHVASYTQSAGVTDIGGNALATDNMTWTGGSIIGGGQLNAINTLLIDSASPLVLDGTTLNNSGTATWIAGNIGTVNGSTFDNLAGAAFRAQSDATFNTTFNNVGTFTLAGSATTSIDTLNNSATVNLQSGTLDVVNYTQTGGVTDLGGSNTLNATNLTWTGGTFRNGGQVNALDTLFISGSNPLTLDGASLSNAGTGTWTAGNINTVNGSTFNNLSSATFTAQSNAAFHTTFNNDGTFVSSGGGTMSVDTLNNAGTLSLQGGILNVTTYNQSGGFADLNGRTLKATDVTWTGGTIDNGGQLDVTQSLLINGVSSLELDRSTINNYRTATWTAGDINTINSGTFNNFPGSVFTAQSDAAFHTTFNNGGTLVLAGNAVTSIDTLNNNGLVVLQSGTLNTNNYAQSAGATYLQGQTLGASGLVQILGGSLVGSGTIDGNLLNNGQLTPGAIGILLVNGNYTQLWNGVLSVAIGGANPGQFDQLQVSGTANLHGTLSASFTNGYSPGPSDSYAVVLYGTATSPFDVVTINNPKPAVQLGPIYGPKGMAIAAVPPPLPTGNSYANQSSPYSSIASLGDLVFAHPGFIANLASDAGFERLPLSGAGGQVTENAWLEASTEIGKGSLTVDLRHTGGSAGLDESGADDDLVAALLAASSDFGPISDSDFLSGAAIGTSLLTGFRPKADIIPRKGSHLASVATLLSGDIGAEALVQTSAVDEGIMPLRQLLINPVGGNGTTASQATSTPAMGKRKSNAGGESNHNRCIKTVLVGGSSLFLGATIKIALPSPKRRRLRRRIPGFLE
jgi:hypothetical protein